MPKGEHLKGGANAATRFSADRQPDKYRQPDLISALLKQELAGDGWAIFEDAEVVGEDNKPTGEKIRVRIKETTARAVARRLAANAAKGRERSIEIVLDRTEGKVPLNLNLGNKDGEAVQINVSTLSTDEKRKMLELIRKAKTNPADE